jgi:hypothetical protein
MPPAHGDLALILAGTAALLLFVFGSAGDPPQPPGGRITVRHQQIIVRLPRVAPSAAAASPTPLVAWREGRGVRCLPVRSLAGATSLGQHSVDLILRDNSRVRARLEQRCPALDYYRGFYIDTTADGRICAGRDFIRSRAGGECQIDRFLTLSPQRR